MWKDVKPWIVAFVINVVSGIVSFWALQDLRLTAIVVLATVLGTIVVLVFLRIEEMSKTLTDLKEDSTLKPPQCCGLHMAGFSQIFEEGAQSASLTIELVSRSYKFLGVSGQFVVKAPNFSELVKRKAQQKGCRFQMILLDPEAEEMVEQHAAQEGISKEIISLNIKESIVRLRALATECDGKLEVWAYRDLPMFRLVLVDDERVYVNFYGAKGMMGVHTPQLVFLKTDRSFFIPFSNFLETTLRGAKRLI